ncbi:MAG TPA: diguanylate cyclase [Bryobacteraceae bacterium]|nr:diguanylate cyclase [Bryobacteraceae bacterium]
MDKLCDLFRNLGNSLDLEDALSTFDRELRPLVDYQAVSVHLLENDRLSPAYAAGHEFQALASLETGLGEGFLGVAAQSGRPVRNCRVEGLGGLGIALVVPLEHSGAPTAVAALFHDRDGVFSEADLETVVAAGGKLAPAIENARKYRDAARLAGIDPLTGLLNARSLFERLDAELARARRFEDRMAVLECAVEGLDGGPELLREVLEQVAAGLRGCCREYDFVAWTDDDLVLVLAGFTRAGLEHKRARIQALVEEAGRNAGLPLFARVGAAFFPEDGSDAEDLLAAAANKLQLAKRVAPGTAHGLAKA